ncbi:hypothetical protein DFH06DRAFT_1412868 [Mycena polygramma]|nr:hypothetical protein DFH06DRAFT_1412868 [Mycena polygramma]
MSQLLDQTSKTRAPLPTDLSASLVACVQAWYYFNHQNDGWPLKLYVAVVLFVDTVHQALITHTIYVLTGLTALLVQSFLAVRVWRLSKGNKWLTGAAAPQCLLILAEFASISAYVTLALPFDTFTELANLKALSIAVNSLAASGDVLIASILCLLLLRSRTGFTRSDTVVNKLVMFFVNTGLITSLFAVASLISITVAPTTFIYIFFFFCMGRLYSNSLFAILNARGTINNVSSDGNLASNDMPLSVRLRSHGARNNTSTHPELTIKIDTNQESDAVMDNKNGLP